MKERKHGPYWDEELVELRDWLKETKTSRQYVATKLGVSVGTVNNWLCGNRPIPRRVRVRIMAHKRYVATNSVTLAERSRAVAAPLTGAEYAEVLSAAIQTNYTVEELASAGLMSFVHAILEGKVHLSPPKRKTIQ